jgi:hypothetical protein
MPTTIQALVIIALVISPGYVFAKLAGGVIAFAREPGDLRFLLPTITCGTVVHIVLSPWTFHIVDLYNAKNLTDHPFELVMWGIALIFVVPAILGIGIGRFSNIPWVDRQLDKVGLGYIDRTWSAWDYVLRQGRPGFMRVHLKDGSMVGGEFFAESFASTTPERADLFLERAWQLDKDGNFEQALLDGQGIWIAHDTMQYIEFFSEGNRRDQKDERETGTELLEQANPAT